MTLTRSKYIQIEKIDIYGKIVVELTRYNNRKMLYYNIYRVTIKSKWRNFLHTNFNYTRYYFISNINQVYIIIYKIFILFILYGLTYIAFSSFSVIINIWIKIKNNIDIHFILLYINFYFHLKYYILPFNYHSTYFWNPNVNPLKTIYT